MNLALHGRVLWRFRLLVAIGTLVSIALTLFAVVRVDISHRTLKYRSDEQWTSYARIFVTQPGFPYGAVTTGGDPTKLAANAILYSQLANSDPVKHLAFGKSKPGGTIEAAPILASASSSEALPIISMAATSATAEAATKLARLAMHGLIQYVERQQIQARIDIKNRVVLQVIAEPRTAVLVKGRSKTLAIVVFMASMLAVMGLAFILENLRPLAKSDELLPLHLSRQRNLA